jgi:hypothetical protein
LTSYSEIEIFPAAALAILDAATRIMAAIPDLKDRELRCHEVARVVGILLNLRVIDGKYGAVEHSWLMVDDSWSHDGPVTRGLSEGTPDNRLVTC